MSGDFFDRHGGRAFFEHRQAIIASRKLPSGYDERASATAFYAYTDNDPLDQTDPSGRCPWCVWGAAIGGGVELGVQIYHGNDPYHAYLTGGWTAAGASLLKIGVAAGGGAATGGVGTLVSALGVGTVATVGTTAFFGASTSANVYAINSCAIDRNCSGSGLAISMATGALDVGGGGPLGDLAAGTAARFGANAGQQFIVNAGTQATFSGLVSGVGQEVLQDQFGNNSGGAGNAGTSAQPNGSSSSLGNVNFGNSSSSTSSSPPK